MLAQNRFLRQHALADYGTILKGIARDPVMMRWLDISGSVRGRPNENYARELMELFTLGVGNYTEQDIREAARAFTGFVTDREGRVSFVRARHDDGPKTVLGRTGRRGPDDIVDIILDRPEAAVFLARKLLRFFVRPDPSADSVAEVARVLRETGFSVKSALRRLFNLPEFSSPEAYRSLVKSPAEYVAGAIRQLGAEMDGPGLPAMTAQMGQTLFNPPNVAGWPGSTLPTGWPPTGRGPGWTPPPGFPTGGCRRRRGYSSTGWGSFSWTATWPGSSGKCFWSSARRWPATRAVGLTAGVGSWST